MKIAKEIAEAVFPAVKYESMYQKDVRLGTAEHCVEVVEAKLEPVREAIKNMLAKTDACAFNDAADAVLALFDDE